MKNIFRKIVVGYIFFWILLTVFLCTFIWNRLERFQKDYDAEKKIISNQQNGQEGNLIEDEKRFAPEMITLSYDYVKPALEGVHITAYSNMQILLGNEVAECEVEKVIENQILSDYSELTGNLIEECEYVVGTKNPEEICVKNSKGEILTATKLDYTASVYEANPDVTKIVFPLFEQYLKHISKMVTLEELQSVMRTSSKAYKAVRNSQKSLEWMIAAKQMTFSKEEVKNVWFIDEKHMVCDLIIDLTKVTENNRTVNESVKYRVLYENISEKWYIYSFEIIA